MRNNMDINQPKNTFFKIVHILLTILLVTLIIMNFFFGGLFKFFFTNNCVHMQTSPSFREGIGERLYAEKQLSDEIWLYEVESPSMMVGTDWYFYYLSYKIDKNPLKILKERLRPILVTDDDKASFTLSPSQKKSMNPVIVIKCAGKISDFSNDHVIYKDKKTFRPILKIEATSRHSWESKR